MIPVFPAPLEQLLLLNRHQKWLSIFWFACHLVDLHLIGLCATARQGETMMNRSFTFTLALQLCHQVCTACCLSTHNLSLPAQFHYQNELGKGIAFTFHEPWAAKSPDSHPNIKPLITLFVSNFVTIIFILFTLNMSRGEKQDSLVAHSILLFSKMTCIKSHQCEKVVIVWKLELTSAIPSREHKSVENNKHRHFKVKTVNSLSPLCILLWSWFACCTSPLKSSHSIHSQELSHPFVFIRLDMFPVIYFCTVLLALIISIFYLCINGQVSLKRGKTSVW